MFKALGMQRVELGVRELSFPLKVHTWMNRWGRWHGASLDTQVNEDWLLHAILRNARHEAFAQALAKGMTATDAYSAAGYKGDRTAASRLSTNVNLSKRVDQIKSRVAEKAEWTAADRLQALKTIFEQPRGERRASGHLCHC